MQHPTTVKQKPSLVLDSASQFGRFAFDSRFLNLGSDRCSPALSNFLFFNSVGAPIGGKKQRAATVLSLGGRGGFSIWKNLNDFNRPVSYHCQKIPIGFAPVQVGSGDNNGMIEDGCGVLEDDRLTLNGVEAEKPKRVLILMSDSGGHRASTEAIKAAFYEWE